MADVALYRKYRSADFSQVLGQDHIVKTLTTAISSGRLSHAYLFTGPRGVGKTSVARLLARALNCTGSPKPCNHCATCQAALNSSLDIVEIDAASNRSIDSVRELRDKISLAPAIGRYKVYIIDEVHMLTTEAFNALLKTLEEPPAHAVFILATTEAHKVPETIISRTQRFTFKPHTDATITAHLSAIAQQEGIAIEPTALNIIATTARGGFRDAISLLDQVSASGEQPITAATVRSLLGQSDLEAVSTISQAIVTGQPQTALNQLAVLVNQGAQPGQIALQLIDYWRSILLTSIGSVAPADASIKALAESVSAQRAAGTIEALLDITRSHWPQLALEAALVKLTTTEPGSSADRPAITGTAAARTAPAKPAAPAPAQPQSHPNTPPGPAALDSALWPKVQLLLKQKNNSLGALVQMYPVEFGPDAVTIKSGFNFHRDLFLKPQNRQMIEAAAARVYGRAIAITAVTDQTRTNPGTPSKPKVDPATELVSSALEILGGEIVE